MCPCGFRASGTVFRVGWAGVAQLVEHLICNQRVGGSNPFASSTFEKAKTEPGTAESFCRRSFCAGPVLRGDPTEVHAPDSRSFSGKGLMRCDGAQRWVESRGAAGLNGVSGKWFLLAGGDWAGSPRTGLRPWGDWAQVAEWLMAADCKSATLRVTEVRILPCAP